MTTQYLVRGRKLCTRCGESKLAEEFGRDPKLSSGLTSWCRACKRAYDNARNAARRATAT